MYPAQTNTMATGALASVCLIACAAMVGLAGSAQFTAAPLGILIPCAWLARRLRKPGAPDSSARILAAALAAYLALVEYAARFLLSGGDRRPLVTRPEKFGLEYEAVRFPTPDGLTLSGWFIPAKKATADGKFSWETMECLGACEQGPALQVNDRLVGKATEQSIAKLKDLK
jgi:hypothetical protein